MPTSQAFVYDKWTTTGYTLQDNFVDEPLVFLICMPFFSCDSWELVS